MIHHHKAEGIPCCVQLIETQRHCGALAFQVLHVRKSDFIRSPLDVHIMDRGRLDDGKLLKECLAHLAVEIWCIYADYDCADCTHLLDVI